MKQTIEINLKKEAPKYTSLSIDENGCSDVTEYKNSMGKKLIEIKALEDALELLDGKVYQYTNDEYSILEALKELVK